MRDRINNAVEELDDIGRSIYLAEVAGWKELVSIAGMPTTLASVIDGISIVAGVAVFLSFSGWVGTLGAVLILTGVIGILRRVLS